MTELTPPNVVLLQRPDAFQLLTEGLEAELEEEVALPDGDSIRHKLLYPGGQLWEQDEYAKLLRENPALATDIPMGLQAEIYTKLPYMPPLGADMAREVCERYKGVPGDIGRSTLNLIKAIDKVANKRSALWTSKRYGAHLIEMLHLQYEMLRSA